MSSASRISASKRLKLLQLALQRFERARVEGGVRVTDLVRFRSGRGVAVGRMYHRSFASMPLDEIAAARWEGALPLAWRFRFGWLYGIADSVVFERGAPVAVIELKSGGVTGGAKVQASLYALLITLNFCARPRVYVRTPETVEEVVEWELLALRALDQTPVFRADATTRS